MISTFYRKTNGHVGTRICEAYYKVSQLLLDRERVFPGSDKKGVLRLCRKFRRRTPLLKCEQLD